MGTRSGRVAFDGPVKMTNMESARDRLASEGQKTLLRLACLTHDFDGVVAASRDTNADDEHDPEGATIAFERSQVGALVRQAEHHLEEIDAAMKRLDAGTYRTCEGCGVPIGEERLDARPDGTYLHSVRHVDSTVTHRQWPELLRDPVDLVSAVVTLVAGQQIGSVAILGAMGSAPGLVANSGQTLPS